MRPSLNELQKEYCVKMKLIALDWQWVTLICWCQMNRLRHSSTVMHKNEGKTHTILEKMKITSGKSTLFWHFFVKYFQITCVDIWTSLNKNNNTPILHTCLTSCCSCLCSTTGHLVVNIFWGVVQVKMKKTIASSWFHRKLNFLEKSIFGHFYDSIGYIKKNYSTNKFCVDSRYEIKCDQMT